jgi:hypothetical protein
MKPHSDTLDRFDKLSVTGRGGNLFLRVEALENVLQDLLTSGYAVLDQQSVSGVVSENWEFIRSSVEGGTNDPTDPAFTGVVISQSGQWVGGVLYHFALIEDGVVITGWGEDGGTIVVGGGDVFGDTVPSVADHIATFTDATGKHIKDSGLRAVGDAALYIIGIGENALGGNTGLTIVAIGYNAGQNNSGSDVVAIGLNAGISNTGNDVILIGNSAGHGNLGGGLIAIGSQAAGSSVATNAVAIGNQTGSHARMIALGFYAGRHETASDRLYIDSRNRVNEAGDRAGAIIYGVMDDDPALQELTFNANVTVNGDLTVTGAGGGGSSLAQILAVSSMRM